jgi:hypothetical protein
MAKNKGRKNKKSAQLITTKTLKRDERFKFTNFNGLGRISKKQVNRM